jgi:hypothetical protein
VVVVVVVRLYGMDMTFDVFGGWKRIRSKNNSSPSSNSIEDMRQVA